MEHSDSVRVIGQLLSSKPAYAIGLGLGLCRKQRRCFLLIDLESLVASGLRSTSASISVMQNLIEAHLFLDGCDDLADDGVLAGKCHFVVCGKTVSWIAVVAKKFLAVV